MFVRKPRASKKYEFGSAELMKVAVVPARGGSKRIPRKNIRHFKGRPIILYAIDAALQIGVFDKVLVSTDDPEIGSVAESGGAEVLFSRPQELADDHATLHEVMSHAIGWMYGESWNLDLVAMLYATAPMLDPQLLASTVASVANGEVRKCLSVASMPFPAQRALVVNNEGELSFMLEQHRFSRSQDLPLTYQDAAQFVVSKPECFLDPKVPYHAVKVPQFSVQDIDNEEDWVLAEMKYDMLLRLRTSDTT